jgi:hypothetical protein
MGADREGIGQNTLPHGVKNSRSAEHHSFLQRRGEQQSFGRTGRVRLREMFGALTLSWRRCKTGRNESGDWL